MPLDPDAVMKLVRSGCSIVCATCEHFWRAKEHNLVGCGQDCCGPINGKNFPAYKGELPDLVRWCFVCGSDSTHALQVGGQERRVGVCQAHLSYLSDLVPKDFCSEDPSPVYASRGGAMIRVERVIRKHEKTLVQAMMEQEKAWQEEDRHNAEKLGIDPDKLLEN